MIHYILGITVGGFAGLFGLRKYLKGGYCYLNNRIDDKVVLITGANTGIGFETALELAKRGAFVHLACRNNEYCYNAKEKIVLESGVDKNRIFCYKLDLASFRSILDFANQFKSQVKKLDILINNAGVMMCPYGLTEDGFEIQMGVNHLGHFLLTNELINIIKINGGGRIINVSSRAHQRGSLKDLKINTSEEDYKSRRVYEKSKLANVLHARYLAKNLEKDNVAVVSLHPGVVATEIVRHLNATLQKLFSFCSLMFVKSPNEGAQTSIYCALLPDLQQYSGQYFSDCAVKVSPNPEANDDELARKIWEESSKLVDKKIK